MAKILADELRFDVFVSISVYVTKSYTVNSWHEAVTRKKGAPKVSWQRASNESMCCDKDQNESIFKRKIATICTPWPSQFSMDNNCATGSSGLTAVLLALWGRLISGTGQSENPAALPWAKDCNTAESYRWYLIILPVSIWAALSSSCSVRWGKYQQELATTFISLVVVDSLRLITTAGVKQSRRAYNKSMQVTHRPTDPCCFISTPHDLYRRNANQLNANRSN